MFPSKDWQPHESHKMSEWENTIVTLSSGTSRFGLIRSCTECGAEEAKTVAGHEANDELNSPCV